MRISTSELQNVLTAYLGRVRRDGQRSALKAGEGERLRDSIALSKEAQLLTSLRAELDRLPEIDSERVEELRERVRSGEYDVPAEEIAEKIIARALANRLAGVAEQE